MFRTLNQGDPVKRLTKCLTVIAAALAACTLSLPAAAVGNIADIVIHDRRASRSHARGR